MLKSNHLKHSHNFRELNPGRLKRAQLFISLILSLGLSLSLISQDRPHGYEFIDAGDSLRRQMQLDDAFDAYLKAEQYLTPINEWEGVVRARGHRVRILLQRRQFDEATDLAESTLAIAQQHFGPKHREIGALYNLMAAIRGMRFSDYQGALTYHKLAHESVEGLVDDASREVGARALESVGMTYSYMGFYDEAIPYFEKGMAIFRELKGDSCLALAFGNQDLGKIKAHQGFYDEALAYYKTCLALMKVNLTPNHDFISQIYLDIGVINQSLGRYAEALDYFNQAEISYTTYHGKKHLGVAHALEDKGSVYVQLGQYDKAITAYDTALAIMQAVLPNRHIDIAGMHHKLSDYYVRTREYESALREEESALTIYQELYYHEPHPIIARSLAHLGEIELQRKNYKNAIAYLKQARGIQLQFFTGTGPQRANIELLLAQTYLQMARPDSALLSAHAARDALMLSGAYNPVTAQPLFIDVYNSLAKTYEAMAGDSNEAVNRENAIEAYDSASVMIQRLLLTQSEDSRTFWLERVFPIYEDALDLLHEKYLESGDLKTFEHAFNFSENNKSSHFKLNIKFDYALRFSGIDTALIKKEQRLQQALTSIEESLYEIQIANSEDSIAVRKKAHWEEEAFRLRAEYSDLIRHIESAYPRYYSLKYQSPEISLKQVRDNLRDDQAVVEYFLGTSAIHAFCIWADGHLWIRIDDAVATDRLVREYISLLSEFSPGNENSPQRPRMLRSTGHGLYLKLLQPIRKAIPKNINSLRVIPDGALCFLPFEALLVSETESGPPHMLPWLIRDYAVSYAYGLFTNGGRKGQGSLNYVGVAPSYATHAGNSTRSNPGSLYHNVEEVTCGQKLFNGKLLTGSEASVSSFIDIAPGGRLLHLAMHAELDDEDPLKSTLLFSDDKEKNTLYLYELFNLDFSANLAILSACNTGKGHHKRGEGVVSLARGFRYAGTESIAMSLWSINDAASQAIVCGFLNGLHSWMPKGQALRQAKLEYINTSDNLSGHPYYWAGIVLIGEDAPIGSKSIFSKMIWLGAVVILLVMVAFLGRRVLRTSDL